GDLPRGEPETAPRGRRAAHLSRGSDPSREGGVRRTPGGLVCNARGYRPGGPVEPRHAVPPRPGLRGREPRHPDDRPGPGPRAGSPASFRLRDVARRPRSSPWGAGREGAAGRGVHFVRPEMAALLRPPDAGSSSAYADHGSGLRHAMSLPIDGRCGSPPENSGTSIESILPCRTEETPRRSATQSAGNEDRVETFGVDRTSG